VTGAPVIGAAAWAFLLFAGVALPVAGVAFALGERRGAGAAHGMPRIQVYVHAVLTHAGLLAAAYGAARASDVMLVPRLAVGLRDLAAAALTFGAVLAIGEVSWRSRPPAERERLWVRRIVPRTGAERLAWVVVSAGAAVAEEIAYRGVFVVLAAQATGSVPAAVVASAVAFAVVHAPQGLAGVGYVFVIALLHQALVLLTGSLLLAVVVHFAYDVAAGLWLARKHGLAA
jgi:membrane protease YdiL (CAAX protease family)